MKSGKSELFLIELQRCIYRRRTEPLPGKLAFPFVRDQGDLVCILVMHSMLGKEMPSSNIHMIVAFNKSSMKDLVFFT